MSDMDFREFVREIRDAIHEIKQDVAKIKADMDNPKPPAKRRWWQM